MLSELHAVAHPSVRLSVTRVDQSKTAEVTMKFSPYGSPVPVVCADKFQPEILTASPRGEPNKVRVGKTNHFLASNNVNISKTVGDTSKVTIND